MTEPCCVAYQAGVVNARIRPGALVVVIGPGPIGLLCATMARLSGAGKVLVVGAARDKGRMETGLAAGATHKAGFETQDVSRVIRERGGGLGADRVIHPAGGLRPLQARPP